MNVENKLNFVAFEVTVLDSAHCNKALKEMRERIKRLEIPGNSVPCVSHSPSVL